MKWGTTYILSFDRLAKHEQGLADPRQDSSLLNYTWGSEWRQKQAFDTRVKQNKAVGANKVDTTSSGLATEKEDEFLPLGVVELIDKLLPLRDAHTAVESEAPIPGERLVCGMLLSMWIVLFATAEFLKQIECLRIIADQDDFIGRVGSDVV